MTTAAAMMSFLDSLTAPGGEGGEDAEEAEGAKGVRGVGRAADLSRLAPDEFAALGAELRRRIIETTARNGGHLAPSLGVVELTMALLAVFNPGRDKIVWDVGHQAYAYKLLTGRAADFHTLRRLDGLCGFPCMSESVYDHFGVGHSSTSISAALGLAHARDLAGEDYSVLAVIGDGSMTAGLAYEGLNQAGDAGRPLIVVLNDNEMSISKNVGALSSFLSRNLSAPWVRRAKKEVKAILGSVPKIGSDLTSLVERGQHSLKGFFTPGMLFEAFRFNYIGPVDGHDMNALTTALRVARQVDRPVLVHVLTTKGKGYAPAEANPVHFHGVGRFSPESGEPVPPTEQSRQTGQDGQASQAGSGGPAKTAPSYTSVFGATLTRFAADNPRIMAITAAMPEGTGLGTFAEAYPERFVDVGICEQHAVTFAGGLAAQGYRPFVAIYSTFLQRAYDQIVHDVCLQNLPVTFCVDRAGLVGEDGATHQGQFDIAFLRHIPNLAFLAPRDEGELARAVATAVAWNGPFAFRYPRGAGTGAPVPGNPQPFAPGEAEILCQGDGSLALVALGAMVDPALAAARAVEREGGPALTVMNARWIRPLPEEALLAVAKTHKALLVLEEGNLAGGFGSAVLEFLAGADLHTLPRIQRLGIPDRFVEHGAAGDLRARYGLDAEGIICRIRSILLSIC